jgi:hypothetical protein
MNEDRALSFLVLAVTTAFALHALPGRTAAVDTPPRLVGRADVAPDHVDQIAAAIAVAEGYYARGEHDGRSLPYRLNNPGALKKPALGAADLPTWRDTGLVIFPTPERGWAALRHQVRLMLTGGSRIYAPSDTLVGVARKYTGGDQSDGWSWSVARSLGVGPDATLADLRRGR